MQGICGLFGKQQPASKLRLWYYGFQRRRKALGFPVGRLRARSLALPKLSYCSRDRAFCGTAFACASKAVLDWTRIWALVNPETSSAISASLIVDSEA